MLFESFLQDNNKNFDISLTKHFLSKEEFDSIYYRLLMIRNGNIMGMR